METRRDAAKKETRSALIRAALKPSFMKRVLMAPVLTPSVLAPGIRGALSMCISKIAKIWWRPTMADTLERIVERVIDSDSESEASLLRDRDDLYREYARRRRPRGPRDEGPRFHQFLEACHRSPRVREVFQETIGKVLLRPSVSWWIRGRSQGWNPEGYSFPGYGRGLDTHGHGGVWLPSMSDWR